MQQTQMEDAASAAPVLLQVGGYGSWTHRLRCEEAVIGRSAHSDIQVKNDDTVSRRHCRIVKQGPVWALVDVTSTNGTRVNGTTVGVVALHEGDRIEVGHSTFYFFEAEENGVVDQWEDEAL